MSINKSQGRQEPHATDAEQAILGVCLNNGSDVSVIYKILEVVPDPSYFYESKHRKIFGIIIDLLNDSLPVDITIVGEEMKRKKLLDECGGLSYLSELATGAAMPSNAVFYANLVREKYLYRKTIERSIEIVDQCYRQEDPPKQIIENQIGNLFSLSGEIGQNRFSRLSEGAAALFERFEAISKGKVSFGLPTGFWGIDKMTNGLGHGSLVIVAARPGMGKTAWCDGVAQNVAKEGGHAGFISCETPIEEFLVRTLCSMGKVDSNLVKRGKMESDHWDALGKAQSTLSEYKYDFLRVTPTDVNTIISQAMSLHSTSPLDVLFIDYLQRIRHPNQRLQKHTAYGEICDMLKHLALQLNIPVVLLCQLNRKVEMRPNKRPILSDLAESGEIEQVADMVIGLYRHHVYAKAKEKENETYLHQAEAIILKSKNSEIGTVHLYCDMKYTLFDNLTSQQELLARVGADDNPDDPF